MMDDCCEKTLRAERERCFAWANCMQHEIERVIRADNSPRESETKARLYELLAAMAGLRGKIALGDVYEEGAKLRSEPR